MKAKGGKNQHIQFPSPALSSCPVASSLFSYVFWGFFFSLFSARSLPALYKKAARLCRRLELQNKSHLVRGECGDRGGKGGRERFPLSHRKRKNRGEIAKGIKAYCSLEGNCWKPKGVVEVGESDGARRRKLKAGEIGFGFCHNHLESREAGVRCDPAGRR